MGNHVSKQTKLVYTVLEYDDTFFLVRNTTVSEQEMVHYAHRKSWPPPAAILDSTTIESQKWQEHFEYNGRKKPHIKSLDPYLSFPLETGSQNTLMPRATVP